MMCQIKPRIYFMASLWYICFLSSFVKAERRWVKRKSQGNVAA